MNTPNGAFPAAQPELIPITPALRLRKYDGHYALFLPGYQDPVVYQNSEGIFDEADIPTLSYVKRMCEYLSIHGELYYIEVLEDGGFRPVGDVTVKPENPPIAIWQAAYRGRGIGRLVMQTVMARLHALGFPRITGTTVYRWNTASQKLHESLGFVKTAESETELFYECDLSGSLINPSSKESEASQ